MKYFNQLFDIPVQDFLMLYDALLEKHGNMNKEQRDRSGWSVSPHTNEHYHIADIDRLCEEMREIYKSEDRFNQKVIG